MTKQEFLDKPTKTKFDWALKEVLIRMSKTQIETIRRRLAEINTALYTTEAKKMSFSEVFDTFVAAELILTEEKQTQTNEKPKQ